MFSFIYNIGQLLGWSIIFALSVFETIKGTEQTEQIVQLIQIMQITQVYDLISNILGLTSGSLISNILQLGGRLVIALLFMYTGVDFCCLTNAAIPWSLAEIIRFSYYLFKNISICKTLRYNAFMILYPVGILGELRLVNSYLHLYGENLIYQLRGLQSILIIGGLFMFSQMLKAKGKHSKQEKQENKNNQKSNSPTQRPKRE